MRRTEAISSRLLLNISKLVFWSIFLFPIYQFIQEIVIVLLLVEFELFSYSFWFNNPLIIFYYIFHPLFPRQLLTAPKHLILEWFISLQIMFISWAFNVLHCQSYKCFTTNLLFLLDNQFTRNVEKEIELELGNFVIGIYVWLLFI